MSRRSRRPSRIFPGDLAFTVGVVALGLQGGPELVGGDEEGATFADGFEVAYPIDGYALSSYPADYLSDDGRSLRSGNCPQDHGA